LTARRSALRYISRPSFLVTGLDPVHQGRCFDVLHICMSSAPCTFSPRAGRAAGRWMGPWRNRGPSGTSIGSHEGWTVRDDGSFPPSLIPQAPGEWVAPAAYTPHPGVAGPTEVISIGRTARHGPRGE